MKLSQYLKIMIHEHHCLLHTSDFLVNFIQRPSYAAFYPKPTGPTVIGGKDLSPAASRRPMDSYQPDNNRFYGHSSTTASHTASSSSTWSPNVFSGPPAGPSTSSALRKALEARYLAQNQVPYPGSSSQYSQPSTDHPIYPPPQGSSGRLSQPPVQQPIPPYVHKMTTSSLATDFRSSYNAGTASPTTPRFPFEALLKQKDVIIQVKKIASQHHYIESFCHVFVFVFCKCFI